MGVGFLRSSVLLSLAVHVFFALACAALLRQRAANEHANQFVMMEFDVKQRSKSLTPAEIQKKKEALSQENRIRQQIVQTERGKLVEHAPRDAFLGERNQQVEEQTVSLRRESEMDLVSGERAKKLAKEAPRSSAKSAKTEKSDPTGRSAAPALSSLGLAILPALRDRAENAPMDEPQWAEQGTSPQDYVRGIRESDRTALNTKEYVFYGYFQRIRSRLDRAWVPILRDKLIKIYKMGRGLASDMDHTTRVLVILNSGGEIVRVEVVNESGNQDLDDAAVRAFNRAGPFPNPPKGIADGNGEIRIPWEFILKT